MTGSGRLRILGLPLDPVSPEEAVTRVAEAIGRRRAREAPPRDTRPSPSDAPASGPFRVVVSNANKVYLAERDPDLREALEGADLVVPEYAMVWAARRLGVADPEFVGGISLMRRLLAEAGDGGWSVFLLGARPGVAERLARRLEDERPGLRIVGHHHGYLDDDASAAVRDRIREVRPDLLFVAMGSPRQEKWIFRHGLAGVGAAMGVGGSFDVLAGEREEAPSGVRASGWEWLWRTAQEPLRLGKRYAVVNSWFVWRVARERMRSLWGDGAGPAPPEER